MTNNNDPYWTIRQRVAQGPTRQKRFEISSPSHECERPPPRPSTPMALAAVACVAVAGWIGWEGGAMYERTRWLSPVGPGEAVMVPVTWSTPIEADQGRPRDNMDRLQRASNRCVERAASDSSRSDV